MKTKEINIICNARPAMFHIIRVAACGYAHKQTSQFDCKGRKGAGGQALLRLIANVLGKGGVDIG
jgi:hypothetical protein